MEPEEKSSSDEPPKEFAKLIVDGVYSNAECARRAGYSQKVAVKYARQILNGKDFPLVPEHIAELRQERAQIWRDVIGQLKRLSDLSHNAEAEGQFSCRNQRRKIRASLGGLTVDRRENQHVHSYDQLTREEIIAQLGKLRDEHPAAFIEAEYEEILDANTGTESVAQIESRSAQGDAPHKD